MEAQQISKLQDIHAGTQTWKVKVKIIRLWNRTYSTMPTVVSSIDMVCIDEQGTRIQATVKGSKLIRQFKSLLEEGGIRVLSKFGVGVNTGRYLLTRHPCKINFNPDTSVRFSNEWAGPEQPVEPISFDMILSREFDSVYSFDVIGEVIHCEDTKAMTTKGRERRVKHLQLQNDQGTVIKCCLWDEHATKLDTYLADPEKKDVRVILLIQFAKLGKWDNDPQISNSMFGSKVYINADFPAFYEFKERLFAVNPEPIAERFLSSTTKYSDASDYWLGFEFKYLDELIDMKQESGCVVVATILEIETANGWFYQACNKCNLMVQRHYQLVDENSEDEGIARFSCNTCNMITTDVHPRIKVYIRVQDSRGSGSLTLFERDVTTYVNKSASQLISSANKGELFPADFNMFVGKKFAFKIKISTFNFKNRYYVYTVNRISDDESVINAILKKASVDEDATSDDDSGENVNPLEAVKRTASITGSKRVVEDDDADLVITGSSSKAPVDVAKLKIPKIEKS